MLSHMVRGRTRWVRSTFTLTTAGATRAVARTIAVVRSSSIDCEAACDEAVPGSQALAMTAASAVNRSR
ncbi:MAG: hypothetical protein L7S64_06325 [Longimicrobiales bacterium]|nr:hypothetical protein [Longimicrobiales bacterium]